MRSKSRYLAAGALALALLVSLACLRLEAVPALAATPPIAVGPELTIQDAWIRWLPADLPAAGYLTLINTGAKPLNLIAATSPAYTQVTLHRTVNLGGGMQMTAVEHITIDAHSSLDFAATGYHMMLMQATKPLRPGDRVPITLRFADGSSVLVQFEVRNPDSSPAR
jgi:copper(I)-binding protein